MDNLYEIRRVKSNAKNNTCSETRSNRSAHNRRAILRITRRATQATIWNPEERENTPSKVDMLCLYNSQGWPSFVDLTREKERERENIIDYPYSCPCCVLSEETNLVLFSLLLATSVRPKLQSHVATRSSGMVAFRLEKAAVHTRNRHEFRARRRRRRFSKSATLKMRTSNL